MKAGGVRRWTWPPCRASSRLGEIDEGGAPPVVASVEAHPLALGDDEAGLLPVLNQELPESLQVDDFASVDVLAVGGKASFAHSWWGGARDGLATSASPRPCTVHGGRMGAEP